MPVSKSISPASKAPKPPKRPPSGKPSAKKGGWKTSGSAV